MTPCNPTHPIAWCSDCARHMPRLPHLAECRPLTVCIDASTVAMPSAICPMFVAYVQRREIYACSDK